MLWDSEMQKDNIIIMLQAGNIFILLLRVHAHVNDQFYLEIKQSGGQEWLGKASQVEPRCQIPTSAIFSQN